MHTERIDLFGAAQLLLPETFTCDCEKLNLSNLSNMVKSKSFPTNRTISVEARASALLRPHTFFIFNCLLFAMCCVHCLLGQLYFEIWRVHPYVYKTSTCSRSCFFFVFFFERCVGYNCIITISCTLR